MVFQQSFWGLSSMLSAGFIFVWVVGRLPHGPGKSISVATETDSRPCLPIRELSYVKPISEVRVRPVILLSLPLDTGLCSGEGEAAASSMAHKTCLRRLPRQSLLGAGGSGSRSAGLCPRGRPCRPLRTPPPTVQTPPPGFFSSTSPYPALLRLLDLLFFPKDKKNPSPGGFSLPLFPF